MGIMGTCINSVASGSAIARDKARREREQRPATKETPKKPAKQTKKA